MAPPRLRRLWTSAPFLRFVSLFGGRGMMRSDVVDWLRPRLRPCSLVASCCLGSIFHCSSFILWQFSLFRLHIVRQSLVRRVFLLSQDHMVAGAASIPASQSLLLPGRWGVAGSYSLILTTSLKSILAAVCWRKHGETVGLYAYFRPSAMATPFLAIFFWRLDPWYYQAGGASPGLKTWNWMVKRYSLEII